MKLSFDKKTIDYTTTSNDANKRLDVVSRVIFPFLTLSQIFKTIRKGQITVNQQKKPLNYRLNNGDIIHFSSHLPLDQLAPDFCNRLLNPTKRNWTHKEITSYQSLCILDETSDLVTVNKPTGWISHGDYPSLTDWLTWKYPNNIQSSFHMSPVHRLDVGTSGAIVLAKTTNGARLFQEEQSNNRLKKLYLAFVDGIVTKSIHSQLYLTREHKKTYVETQPSNKGKIAITHIYPIATSKSHKTLVACIIETGRTHQIRAVCAHLGHPLVGDLLYNPTTTETNYYLHSFLLQNEQIFKKIIVAPLPQLFIQMLEKHGLNPSELLLLKRYTILLQ